MVYFNCEACNETLKKSQVENHSYRCHAPFSCVDCGQTFPGHAYQKHTTCISEAEKYEKSVYKGPKGGKKKRNPQEIWMDILSAAAEEAQGAGAAGMSALLRDLLPRMVDMGNVPRNEKKFRNYLKNSFRLHKDKDQDELWQYLEKRRAEAQAKEEAPAAEPEAQAPNGVAEKGEGKAAEVEAPAKKRKRTEGREGAGAEAEQASGVADEGGKSKKKKKRKGGEERAEGEGKENGAPHENGEEAQGGVFKWEKEIKRLVKKAENRTMSIKALQKEVLALARGQVEGSDMKALKRLFKEKVNGVAGVVVKDDVVVYDKKRKG